MALTTQNTDAISFKKLSGKAHTDQNFSVSEEGISTNIQLSYTTVFAQPIEPLPVTNSGYTGLYSGNGIIQRVKFQIDIIPNTQLAVGQSQGYRLKLPSDWNSFGDLYPQYSAGTYLHTALGRLQIVPALYGKLKGDGSTEYDPILYQTDGVTQITKFDAINWYFDPYDGVLFVEDPKPSYDTSPTRPGFLEAFLYVGKYINDALAHISGGTGSTGGGTITGATNGLSVSGKNIKLGGALTGSTLLSAGSHNLVVGLTTGKFEITGNTYVFSVDVANQRFIAGNNPTSTGGTINYTFGDTNINNGYFGSVTFGELSEITSNGGDSMTCGEGSFVDAYGGKSFARSGAVRANGSYAFIGGAYDNFAYGKTNLKSPQVNAYAAFGFYTTDGNQVDNHGVNATASVILGGHNHNIPATSDYSAILGGDTIKAATGVTNTVYFPKVRIGQGIGAGIVTNNTNNDILVRNSATGEIEIRDASTLVGTGNTGSSQNIYVNKKIVTGSTTLLVTDFVIFVNGSVALTLILPAAPNDGEVFKIKDVSGNASTNNITINGNGHNIDGSSTITINTDRGGVELCFDTTLNAWFVMNFVG
jgi:hypothetical protein